MLRLEIEKLMKQKNLKAITLWYNEADTMGMGCYLKNGYLEDSFGHRVNRKQDIWGYVVYDGKGNADIYSWDGKVVKPFFRDRYRVDM